MKKKIFLFAVMMSAIFSIAVIAAVQPKGNLVTSTTVKRLPDLVALSMNVTVKDGGPLAAGKETMIACNLKNNGGPFTAEFRIGIRMDGTPLGLPQGSTATPDTTSFATPWVAVAGMHTATCILDTQKVIAESSEANNVAYLRLNVPKTITPVEVSAVDLSGFHATEMKTDITIEKIEVKAEDGSAVRPGKPSRIYCHWKRTGSQPANTFRVLIKMDGTALTLPQGDTVDQTQTASWLGTPWTATAGNHQIYCEVDTQNAVDESNEKNNKWIQLYNLPSITAHDAMDLGQTTTFRKKTDVLIEKIEVKAEDGGKLADGKASRVYCYWKRTGSAPAADFRVAPFVDDVPIGLPQGSTVQHQLENGWLGTPWTARAGSHAIRCLADSAFEIAEPNETNNSMTSGIDVPPAK
jgi:subtilase family serine protease